MQVPTVRFGADTSLALCYRPAPCVPSASGSHGGISHDPTKELATHLCIDPGPGRRPDVGRRKEAQQAGHGPKMLCGNRGVAMSTWMRGQVRFVQCTQVF